MLEQEQAQRPEVIISNQPQIEVPRSTISSVLRNSIGRVRWTLPGNSERGNLQIGIGNIQGLFLQKFPEFDELFPKQEDGMVPEESKEAATRFVLERLGNKKKFDESIGGSAASRQVAPYFEGSYLVAIEKSFAPWGLGFSTTRVKKSLLPRNKKGNIAWAILGKQPKDKRCLTIEQEAARLLSIGVGLSSKELTSAGYSDFLHGIYRYYSGQLSALRTKMGVPSVRKPFGYWIKERIEQEAVQFHAQHGHITGKLLNKHGRGNLAAAINAVYPGGMQSLRDELNIPLKKPIGYWSPEAIEKEAREFLEQVGDIRPTLLRKYGRDDLAIAIAIKYPGRWIHLRTKLGLKILQVPYDYWSTDNIEKEAVKFYLENGQLSFGLLRRQGKNSLLYAIKKKYPGGMNVLKGKLALIDSESSGHIIPPEAANEQLRKLLEE